MKYRRVVIPEPVNNSGPHYNAARQHALVVAKELALALPKGFITFGTALIKRPSDETMRGISKTESR